MGLDMYAYAIKASKVGDMQTDINIGEANGLTQMMTDEEKMERVKVLVNSGEYDPYFAYWRKFNALHGWMDELYVEKGGESNTFNCNTLRLMPEDIDRLESEAATLTPTSGFFFGEQVPLDTNDVEEVKAFCAKARTAHAAGMAVIYDAWW